MDMILTFVQFINSREFSLNSLVIHHQEFWSHLANHEILLQSGARWQILGAGRSYLHTCWFLIKFLVQERGNMEKRDNEFFMQSPARRYLAMPGKLFLRATTSINGRFGSTPKSKKKGGLHRLKERIHIRIRSVDLHFVSSAKHKFCVSPDYIPAGETGRHGTRWELAYFYFPFSAAVTKTGGWTTSLPATDFFANRTSFWDCSSWISRPDTMYQNSWMQTFDGYILSHLT